MREIRLESYAKINLSLDVVRKREDGYHDIETIMQEVDLGDRIILREGTRGCRIDSNSRSIPLDGRNLVHRAYEEISRVSGQEKAVEIYIDKRIPVGGGLAGGSSNAAAVLKGLNELWDLGYSLADLQALGSRIGADVPFCLQGGTAYASGIGDRLEVLPSFKDRHILLANKGIAISTPEVYRGLGLGPEPRDSRIRDKVSYIEEGDLEGLARNMENMMEGLVFALHPELAKLKEDMVRMGALGSLMSGSGSTVFGIFDDYDKMLACQEELAGSVDFIVASKTR